MTAPTRDGSRTAPRRRRGPTAPAPPRPTGCGPRIDVTRSGGDGVALPRAARRAPTRDRRVDPATPAGTRAARPGFRATSVRRAYRGPGRPGRPRPPPSAARHTWTIAWPGSAAVPRPPAVRPAPGRPAPTAAAAP